MSQTITGVKNSTGAIDKYIGTCRLKIDGYDDYKFFVPSISKYFICTLKAVLYTFFIITILSITR